MPGFEQYLTETLMIVGALGWWVALREIYAARQGVRYKVRLILRGLLAFIIVWLVLLEWMSNHPDATMNQENAGLIAAFAAALAVASSPNRSRYIPAKVRRQTIARFEAEAGEKYNSKKHHLDHLWPFVRGGSHTVDNLRVLSKRENLRKGKRKPKPWDWL